MDKRTFGQVLNANMTHHGNRIAIIDGAASWTYAEFGARVFKLANILDELGLKRGDRFAIQAKNGRAFEELRWAGYVSGIVPVAINWRLAPPEIKHVLEDSSSKIIFIDEEFVAVYDSAELDQWQAGLQPIGPGLEAQIEQASTAETNPGVSPDAVYRRHHRAQQRCAAEPLEYYFLRPGFRSRRRCPAGWGFSPCRADVSLS